MNGPEHYAKAEEMLEAAKDAYVLDDNVDEHNLRATAAQVHATLALVAAIADLRLPSELVEVDGARRIYGDSLVDRHLTFTATQEPGTWAGVIRSTIGDPR